MARSQSIFFSVYSFWLGNVIPYIYFLYLLLLLIHRDMRDEQRCARKYGALWEEYCRRVPYRLVPYIY